MHSDTTRQRLLDLLADGQFHSGEALGSALQVSRGAVWKHLQALGALGLDVHRVPGRGYRLARPLERLSEARIRQALAPAIDHRLHALLLFDSIDSTNAQLLARKDGPGAVVACLAEHQQAGRGRRGRNWVSPFGANLYFSLSWPFASLPPDFPALGLAVGVAARRALADIGVSHVQLKWPNDLYFNGAKLGGVLLEMRGEPPGACRVVVGIGINVAMPRDTDVGQAWTDLEQTTGGVPSRNALAAALITHLVEALEAFENDGFAPFRGEWQAADLLAGEPVDVTDGREQLQGTARGVAADGALELETPGGIRRIVAGDATLRRRA